MGCLKLTYQNLENSLKVVYRNPENFKNQDGSYYPFGLKIAGISAKAFDAPKNPYQYQGDYSEYDDETQWNDFELRNYDPQIGRFIQADPYDQFPSPYTGMGNDPINLSDPSGGFSINFGSISTLGRIGVAAGGAAVGFAIDKLTGGNGWTGAAIGGGVALGATFIPPFDIGAVAGVIGDAAPSLAIQGANMIAQYASYQVNNQALNNVLVTVTNQVVGTARTFSYPVSNSNDPSKMIRYEIPIYKVRVSGVDENGNNVSRDFRAIRFGVKNEQYGQVKDSYMQGIEEGTFEGVPWDASYQPHSFESTEKGAWVVKGDYLIHDGPDPGYLGASNGCVEILGAGGFNDFNDYIIKLSGSNAPTRAAQLKEVGQKGLLTVKYEQAKTPPLKVYKKPK